MKRDEQLPDVWQPMESAPSAQPGTAAAQAASYASLERTQVFSRGELEPAQKTLERRPSLVATKLFSRAELGLEAPAPNPETEPVPVPAAAPVSNGTLIIDRGELLNASGAAFSSTRILPIEQWLGAQHSEQTVEVERGTVEPRATEPRRATRFGARVAASFRAAPASRKLTWALLPLALPAALFIVLGGSARAKLPPKKTPHANAPSVLSSRAPAAVAVVAAAPKPLPLPALRAGQSLERAAADAVAEGNTPLAAAYYRQLAAREPDRAAYRVGLRILEARLAAGAPRP